MRWFVNLRIRSKLLTAFLAVTALAVVVGCVGLQGLVGAKRSMVALEQRHFDAVIDAEALRTQVFDVGRLYRQVLLDGTADAAREHADAARAEIAAITDATREMAALPIDAEAKAMVATLQSVLPDWGQRVDATLRLAQAGDAAGARAAATANGQNAATLVKTLGSLTSSLRQDASQAVHAANAAQDRAIRVMIAVLLLAIAAGVGMGIYIAGLIARPVRDAAAVLGRVADGDLLQSLQLDTRDELGDMARALERAVTSMRDSLQQVQRTAHGVSDAATQLSSASQSISAGAQEQASSLEETAASLEEMTSVVQQNAGNAQDAATLARKTHETAGRGGATVSEAVAAMAEIGAASRRIADIITTIDEIAFQTNLLALNAAVEAARAGEQGRGFAVVATEVRNLAQRAASSAREIKSLIEDSVNKVDAGTRLVNESGTLLQEIVRSVSGVSDVVAQIATSSREQSAGIEQVNTAVTQMDSVTQANASQTEELAGTAEGLASQAQQLTALVRRFRLGEADVANVAGVAVAAPVRPTPKLVRRAVAAPAPALRTGTHDAFEEF